MARQQFADATVAVNCAMLTNRHQSVQSDAGLPHGGSTRRLPVADPLLSVIPSASTTALQGKRHLRSNCQFVLATMPGQES